MKKTPSNTTVERIISVVVISYGIWLTSVCLGDIITTIIERFRNGFIRPSSDLPYGFGEILLGCVCIFFFRPIVQWMACFATQKQVRSQRIWTARNLTALFLVVISFRQLFAMALTLMTTPFFLYRTPWYDLRDFGTLCHFAIYLLQMAVLIALYAAIVFHARMIAGWLIRRAARKTGGKKVNGAGTDVPASLP